MEGSAWVVVEPAVEPVAAAADSMIALSWSMQPGRARRCSASRCSSSLFCWMRRLSWNFHGALDLNLRGRLDGCQVRCGCGGSNGGRSVSLEGGEHTELAQLLSPELIQRPTEPPKVLIKVADPLMQGVPLGPSLGQPAVGVPQERADVSTQVADEGHGFLLHGGGLGGEASIVGCQGVELLPLLLHVGGLVCGRPHAESPLA